MKLFKKSIIFILIITSVILLSSCGEPYKKIYGKWNCIDVQTTVGNYNQEFDFKKNGKVLITKSSGETITADWENEGQAESFCHDDNIAYYIKISSEEYNSLYRKMVFSVSTDGTCVMFDTITQDGYGKE